ncbi:MAG: ABC-type transport auxiliary lipoprotein family protein [Woeseiaceae bacterium]
MKKFLCFSLWAFLAATLCGCSGMLTSDEPPEHVYWLEAVTLQFGEALTEDPPELLIVVHTIPGLDTDRILVKEPGARMNYYAGGRWPDHLPEVLTATVRLSLESSGRFSRVSSRSQKRGDEWLLELELREFFAEAARVNSPPQVRIQFVGHLSCGSDATAISAMATVLAQENKLSEIVAAFQSATDKALISLGGQLESRCFLKNAQVP